MLKDHGRIIEINYWWKRVTYFIFQGLINEIPDNLFAPFFASLFFSLMSFHA